MNDCPLCPEEIVRDGGTAPYVHSHCGKAFHPYCLEKWLMTPISCGACPHCQERVTNFFPEDNDDIRFAHPLMRSLLEPYVDLPAISWTGRTMLPGGMWGPDMVLARRTELEEKGVPYAPLPVTAEYAFSYVDFLPKEPVLVQLDSLLQSNVRYLRFWNYHYQNFINREILLCVSRYLIGHHRTDPRRKKPPPPSPSKCPSDEAELTGLLREMF